MKNKQTKAVDAIREVLRSWFYPSGRRGIDWELLLDQINDRLSPILNEKEAQAPEREIYSSALVKYGPSAQFVVALEELAELSKELAKCLRENPSDPGKAARRPQVAEEIADVRNMLAQVEYIMGLETVVEDIRVEKLRRLAGRISGL